MAGIRYNPQGKASLTKKAGGGGGNDWERDGQMPNTCKAYPGERIKGHFTRLGQK